MFSTEHQSVAAGNSVYGVRGFGVGVGVCVHDAASAWRHKAPVSWKIMCVRFQGEALADGVG